MVLSMVGDRWGSNPRSGKPETLVQPRLRHPYKYKEKAGEDSYNHDQITELYLCAQTAEGLALPLDGVPYFPTHDIAFDTAHYPSNAVLPQLPPPPYYPRFVVGLEPQFDDQPISPLKLKLLN